MRKITSLLSLLLFFAFMGGVKAQTVELSTSSTPALPGTLSNGQYTYESNSITANAGTKVIRLTFIDTQEHKTWANAFHFVCLSELELLKEDGTKVGLTAANFSTNATESTGEGPIANICDGNTAADNYWHSAWSNAINDFHYLEIALPDDLADFTAFKLKWVTRQTTTAPIKLYVTCGLSHEAVNTEITTKLNSEYPGRAIAGADNIADNKCYYLDAWRGYIHTDQSNQLKAYTIADDGEHVYRYTPDANNMKFAFLTIGGKKYLYSIDKQKLVEKSGDYTAFTPFANEEVTFTDQTYDGRHEGFDTHIWVGGHMLNNTANNIWTNYDDHFDPGNSFRILEVGDFNAQEAISTLTAAAKAEHAAMLAEAAPWMQYNPAQAGELKKVIEENVVGDNDDLTTVSAKHRAVQAAFNALKAVASIQILSTADGLPGTSANGRYHWDSNVLTYPAAVKDLRFTVLKTNTGAQCNGYQFFTLSEFYLYNASEEEQTLQGDNFTTNAQYSGQNADGTPLSQVIVDRDFATYFHSTYNGGDNVFEHHYIQLAMSQAMQSFKISFESRNGYNVPQTVALGDACDFARCDLYTLLDKAAKYTYSPTIDTQVNEAQAVLESQDKTYDEIIAAITSLKEAINSSRATPNQLVHHPFFRMKGSQNTYLQAGEASSRPNLGESTDANSIMLLTDEGHIVSYAKGLALHASDASGDRNYVAMGGKGAVFYLNETADNKYTVTTKNTSNITALYGGGTQLDKGNFANVESLTDVNYHWTIETIETLPVQVSAAGWATLCVPVALTVPTDVEGLKVYTGTKGENTITLTEVTGTIPAGEPVVICAPEGTHQFTIATTETAKSADNCFAGTTEARTVDASSVLTLQIIDDAIGMYTFTGTALRGFCAYMEKSASAAGMKFDFGQSTGIESLIDATTSDKAIYDLSGRRVNHTAKGIYLIGGKKVVIK